MLHLIKLCVGVETPAELVAWQAHRLDALKRAGAPAELIHRTRHMPKRRAEVLDGGSLYWVIKGVIQLRQRIVDLREEANEEGRTMCAIVFDPELVATRPQARRPFQGWRYLPVEDAPPDLPQAQRGAIEAMPAAMRAELAALSLL
jgi:hypothetical protein